MNHLTRRRGVLSIDNVSCSVLALKYGTPLYVYSESRIRENYVRIRNAFTDQYMNTEVYYAAKANSNIAILSLLRQLDSSVDVVSTGELSQVLKAGFPADRILFTGSNVKTADLKIAMQSGACINIDSISALKRLLSEGKPKILSVRVNPEFGAGHHDHCITAGKDSKFGVWEHDVIDAYQFALKAGVERFGIHMHIGSGIMDFTPYGKAIEMLMRFAGSVNEETGIEFNFIDIGGGFGVPYKSDQKDLNIVKFAKQTCELFTKLLNKYGLGKPKLFIEPGRYIVADAGILLAKVNTINVTPHKIFAGTDVGFHTLVRPAMYGSYHHIELVNRKLRKKFANYDIAGPLCESGDIIARDRRFPILEEGDLLAVMNVGAYGFSMSSNYNSNPKPAEVMTSQGRHAVIRQRESNNIFFKGQEIPRWMK